MTTILTSFYGVFHSGVSALSGPATSLLFCLMTISLVLNHLLKLEEANHLWLLIRECFKFGFFMYVVSNYPSLCDSVLSGFISMGAKAGGGGVSQATLQDPSAIASMGWNATKTIFDQLSTFSLLTNGIVMQLICAVVGFMILLTYFIIAVQVFITFLEFYVIGALALILVPFGVFKHTSFLGEKALGAIVAAGVKVMVLAFILAAALPIMSGFALPANPTLQQGMNLFGGCLCVVFLCWNAPSLAAGLMSGSPVLSGGSVAGAAMSGLSAVALGAATVRAGSQGVQSALGAVRAASGAVSSGSGGGGSDTGSPGPMSDATSVAAGGGASSNGSGLGNIMGHARNVTPPEASPSGGLSPTINHGDS